MKRFSLYNKTVLFTTLFILLLSFSIGCNNSKTDKQKTEWTNCDELIEYIRYSPYRGIANDFGTGVIGEPYDASGVGELNMLVKVKFPKIKLNGKPLVVIFENSHLGIADAFEKNPGRFHAVECNGDDSFTSNVLATQVNTSNQGIAEYMPTDAEENSIGNKDWDDFLLSYIDGVNQKRLSAMYTLSLSNEISYAGGDPIEIRDYFNNSQSWTEIAKSLNTGFELYDMGAEFETARVTKDNHLIFVYKNGFWKWYGIMGD